MFFTAISELSERTGRAKFSRRECGSDSQATSTRINQAPSTIYPGGADRTIVLHHQLTSAVSPYRAELLAMAAMAVAMR